MKTKILYLTLATAILFAAGTIALTGCGNSSNKKSTEQQHEATETEHQHDMDEQHEHGDMAEASYQCPMKCEGDKTYDKPGSCPVCKMDLKKMDEDHEHDHQE